MDTVFARKALLPDGWHPNVAVQIRNGRITSVTPGRQRQPDESAVDLLLPGLGNAHSHAFQRALVGRTEWRSPDGKDNFWSWRQQMYALANRVSPEHLAAIATQAYCEMLCAGYTAVAEFHYLHADPAANDDAMFSALQYAAAASGIRLVYVPVLYERAGFGSAQPEPHQQRFVLALEDFLAHVERCRTRASGNTTVAIGAHSLRATRESSLQVLAATAREYQMPLHLHIAEQLGEVEQCVAATGKRPVEFLLNTCRVDASWCLVHATHLESQEVADLAQSGAVVCVCPTTEANLGDGLFALRAYLEHGGQLAIGSDSQVSIDPFAELRWLEYGQRLRYQQRNVAAVTAVHTGDELYRRALAGGAQALGLEPPGIHVGANADLLALNANAPGLVGLTDAQRLDGLIFSGGRAPVQQTMVAGEWWVRDGKHVNADEALAGYRSVFETWQ